MTTKLNLTIEEQTVVRAKRLAEKEKTSVSRIVNDLLLQWLAAKEPKKKKKSFAERVGGSITDISIPDIDKARDEYLKEKYGL